MNEALLTLQNLKCRRGGRVLFRDLNLSMHAGQCVEVRGPNGCGKSTLLRLVAGLFADYEGGVDAPACIYIGHKSAVSALLSPRENLDWYARICRDGNGGNGGQAWQRPGRRHGVPEALSAMGLQACSDIPCGQLSQGQQRRAALARALISAEPVWLLDEPLTALDGQGRTLVGRLVEAQCAAGGAVLCATHQTLGRADTSTLDLGQGR